MAKKIVVFDLDDTLYNEIDYLKSAYHEIALNISKESGVNKGSIFQDMLNFYNLKKNVFEEIISKYNSNYTTKELLNTYRTHKPNIKLKEDKLKLIEQLYSKKIPMGILTDGRSIQQRNKIEALGIADYFSEIIVSEEFGSEKPDKRNYSYFEGVFGAGQYYYVGDNIKKDFVTPNALNWITIRVLDNGLNVHKNRDSYFEKSYLAQFNITDFKDLIPILEL